REEVRRGIVRFKEESILYSIEEHVEDPGLDLGDEVHRAGRDLARHVRFGELQQKRFRGGRLSRPGVSRVLRQSGNRLQAQGRRESAREQGIHATGPEKAEHGASSSKICVETARMS